MGDGHGLHPGTPGRLEPSQTVFEHQATLGLDAQAMRREKKALRIGLRPREVLRRYDDVEPPAQVQLGHEGIDGAAVAGGGQSGGPTGLRGGQGRERAGDRGRRRLAPALQKPGIEDLGRAVSSQLGKDDISHELVPHFPSG